VLVCLKTVRASASAAMSSLTARLMVSIARVVAGYMREGARPTSADVQGVLFTAWLVGAPLGISDEDGPVITRAMEMADE
jgi:hypothetical protein